MLTGRAVYTAGRLPLLVAAALKSWATLEPRDWSVVASELERIGHFFPRLRNITQLRAKALRSARRTEEAISVNETSLALHPDDKRTLLELGRAQRDAGRREDAIESFVAAGRLGSVAASRELCRYGARARLPAPVDDVVAASDYHSFARLNPTFPPPPVQSLVCFRVTLTGLRPSWEASLSSLQDQTYPTWFLAGDAGPGLPANFKLFDLVLPSGATLDPHCLAWLNWAARETGCATICADHDHLSADGLERCAPVFLPQPDSLWTIGANGIARLVATDAEGGQATAHIPLVLMTLPFDAHHVAQRLPNGTPPRMSIIIPTRDSPQLLQAAIQALLAQSCQRDRLEIIVIDNDSRSHAAQQMFEQLRGQANVKVIPFAEPFNWSRANNLGAAAASNEVLVFLNDDTEMQTQGWDRILGSLLAIPAVGVLGTRMVYPNGSIQHGGFVFGMDNGPQHEGRWMPGDDDGPAHRWVAVRQAAAVTGAFLAISKSDFETVGGFDEINFAVDFADIDLCLRVRELGRVISYCGAITLLHHESASRGLNLSRAQRRRMRRERKAFERRWGIFAQHDPGYHPVWSRSGAAYDGLQAIRLQQVIDHVRQHSMSAYMIDRSNQTA